MKMTNKEYSDYVKTKSPKSPMGGNMIRAFISGGAICCIGQAIQRGYLSLGMIKDIATTATSITLIFIGVLVTGFKVYDNIAKFAGAGTLVPITGFANSVASPALEFKSEGLILGTGAKMFTIAGPVIVYGMSSSVIYGIIYCILT